MSFKCPQCSDPSALEIVFSIQLPKNKCADDITLQVVECGACQFAALAVYEEKRRSISDTRDWKHVGYRIKTKDLLSIKGIILECPDRLNPDCRCLAHMHLGTCNPHGEWLGLEGVESYGSFAMRMRA